MHAHSMLVEDLPAGDVVPSTPATDWLLKRLGCARAQTAGEIGSGIAAQTFRTWPRSQFGMQ